MIKLLRKLTPKDKIHEIKKKLSVNPTDANSHYQLGLEYYR